MPRPRLTPFLATSVLALWILGFIAIHLVRNPPVRDPSTAITLVVSAMMLLGTATVLTLRFRPHGTPPLPLASTPNLPSPDSSSPPSSPPEPPTEDAISNSIHREILKAIPSPVFVLGDAGDFLQINPAAEELSEDLNMVGRLPTRLQHIIEECKKNHSHFMPQDPQDALVFRIRNEEVYFLPRVFRLEAGPDCIPAWAVLLHNVSRIRWLDDMKTNYIASVSHEIKTPLTCIRMVLLLLLEERSGKLDPTQLTLVTSASEDCERLLATVNSLLALSLAESGATHLNRIPISLESCVEGLSERIASSANSRGIKLRIEGTDQAFPKVLADPVRLAEVVGNLVSNAINHSPPDGEIRIRISKPDAEFIRLSVIDQGIGVPEASQSRIFERFYRAPDQPNKGLGLGLFISRDIMTAHEGRIGLMDRNGNTTEFYIDVPIA
jgi:two-component system, NtrC family, sensor histidine kinase KinB